MSYYFDHDETEWRAEVATMNEMQRAATEIDVRMAAGITGDVEDARYE